jgi:hypothetical protein
VSLKTALFQMKEEFKDQESGQHGEELLLELENRDGLKAGVLRSYYQNLKMLNLYGVEQENQPHDDSKKINRKWTNNEIDFMFQYIHDRQGEGALNITEVLEEIAQLLNRGYQSVNYKYYTLVKKTDKKKVDNGQKDYRFTTISQDDIPVLSTELIGNPKDNSQVYQVSSQNDDLLDILSGLITNIQQLPGIDLNHLLRSLYQLTNMALQNQEAANQIKNMRTEINQEKETLQEQLKKKERQLVQEKKRNDELDEEISKLANEIGAFNELSDAAKIQNLKSFNQRLNNLLKGTHEVKKLSTSV